MLKYFKKPGRHMRDDDIKSIESNMDTTDNAKRSSLRSTSSFCNEVFFEEESLVDDAESCGNSIATSVFADEDIFERHSRLAMSLSLIVKDKNCLSYFVQYLEEKNFLHLIKFYLDTENFHASALAQLEIEQNARKDSAQGSEHVSLSVESQEQHNCENEDKNHVPELKTLCDLTMRKPLTDDEKSQIYAETSKQLTHFGSPNIDLNSEPSLCSETESITDSTIGLMKKYYCATASINDALTIYQKYLRNNSPQFISLPISILSQISLILCQDDTDTETELAEVPQVSADCFREAQLYVFNKLEQDFLNDFLQSTYYCKYCIELIQNSNTDLGTGLNIFDILNSESTLFYFMEFLEQRNERDSLDFWTAAINFRKSYSNSNDNLVSSTPTSKSKNAEAQADAMIIYDKYFSLLSESRLWLSERLRSKVEEAICSVEEVHKCFDIPLVVTAKYLEQKFLDNFLNSQLFQNYIDELKSKIYEVSSTLEQNNPAIEHPSKSVRISRHRKTMSDCTAAGSKAVLQHISQDNSLLAKQSKPTHYQSQLKLRQVAANTDMSIDARQFSNPNLLWQRSSNQSNCDLKFGRINALGRYERDFESVDDVAKSNQSWSITTSGSKIAHAMRKLVNLPEEEVQEEIAWQVAEMIVKDVTAVTLSGDRE